MLSRSFTSGAGGSARGQYTLEDIRRAVDPREEAFVVECYRRGEFGEHRPPGLYRCHHDGMAGTVVVFEGDDPPPAILEQLRHADGAMPMVITLNECSPGEADHRQHERSPE
jgi:hypothetical protein